jgi:hypothetical protein
MVELSAPRLTGWGMAEAPDPELTRLRDVLVDRGAPRPLLHKLDLLDGAGDIPKTLLAMLESRIPGNAEAAIGGILFSFLGMLEPAGPLEAELSGAQFISLLRRGASDEADVPRMLADLIEQAAVTKTPEALAMLRVLAVLRPPQVRQPATEAADRLGLPDPGWVRGLGTPKPRTGFGYTDASGAKETVCVTFAYGWKRHAIVVQIGHDLGGGVQNCFFFTQRVRVLVTAQRDAARDQNADFLDYKPARAREILDQALAQPSCPETQVQVEDIDMYLGLVRSRVELLPK